MIVLVTDGETRAALELVRALAAAGHEVHVSAARRWSLAGLSRGCAGEHRQAPAEVAPPEIAASVLDAADRAGARRIAGVVDRTLTALHLGGVTAPRLLPPAREAYFSASDKTLLFSSCLEWGIDVPEGEVVEGGRVPEERLLARLGDSWALRPSLSWRWDGARWIHGAVRLIEDRERLRAHVRDDPAFAFPYLLQRRIDGDGCGLFFTSSDGRPTALFAHRRVREKPPWGGVSTVCRSVAPPADLVRVAERFAARTGWSGLAMLEFKRDRDGRPWLLEVNARPWGSLALSRAAGVDFATSWLTPTDASAPPDYREGVHLRWWWGDVDHYYLREKSAGSRGVSALLKALARAVAAGPSAEVWDTFRREDPLPFAHETLRWLKRDLG